MTSIVSAGQPEAASPPATLAYLVLAHAANEQLHLLVDRLLADPRSHIYIHMDAKTKDIGFLAGPARARVTVLTERVVVSWGGFSVVSATLKLLAAAFQDGTHTRFVLLSGACFPLKSPQAVNDTLLGQPDPVLAIWGRIDAGLKRNEGFGRYVVTKFHPLDVPGVNPKTSRLHELVWNQYKKLNNALPYERNVDLTDLWKGSQFFVADRALVAYFLSDQTQLVSALRYALAPDEIFFATLFVRYQRARGQEVTLSSPAATLQGIHFIRKYVPAQRTLGEKIFKPVDLRRLDPSAVTQIMASGALFARKCSAAVSREIIKACDAA